MDVIFHQCLCYYMQHMDLGSVDLVWGCPAFSAASGRALNLGFTAMPSGAPPGATPSLWPSACHHSRRWRAHWCSALRLQTSACWCWGWAAAFSLDQAVVQQGGLLRWLRCGLHGHLSPGLSKRKMPRCIEHVLLWSRSSGYRPAAGPRTQALEAVGAWRHQRVASDLGASTGDRRSRAEECPSLGHLPVGTTSSWSVGLPHAG